MEKYRNVLFLLVAFVLLTGAIGPKVLDRMGVPLPAQLEVGKKNSSLEGRKYTPRPHPTIKNLTKGEFQANLDKYISDIIPMRDQTLLTNAALQRAAISGANAPFGFDPIPTFFGSGYYYQQSIGRVAEMPYSQSKYDQLCLRTLATSYSTLIEGFPDINWQFWLVDRIGISSNAEASLLSSKVADFDWFQTHFLNWLPLQCTARGRLCKAENDYLRYYFLTDHHWRMQGAYRAYSSIVSEFGKEPVPVEFFECYSGPFWGSAARTGLCPKGAGDSVDDIIFSQGSIKVYVDGKQVESDWIGGSGGVVTTYEKKHPFTSVYGNFYHGDRGLVVLDNTSVPDGQLLIIGDSYTDCIERLFATNYSRIHVIDPRRYGGKISDYISTHDIGDAVFLLAPPTLINDECKKCIR